MCSSKMRVCFSPYRGPGETGTILFIPFSLIQILKYEVVTYSCLLQRLFGEEFSPF